MQKLKSALLILWLRRFWDSANDEKNSLCRNLYSLKALAMDRRNDFCAEQDQGLTGCSQQPDDILMNHSGDSALPQ